ncbi:MAG: RNA 3'-terminal phosphate cyclase [Planctomycetales bacterium]|nr:RNA 3'-terminal phosphate cyclase [Planctomycetales bacterium]
MLTIDGSIGEGGGQVLRSSLALAIITGTPVRLVNIRAGRPKPGLQRQHLTSVEAAATISGATVRGAAIGSRELTFQPGAVQPGEYHFAVGTAGSASLVLQTVLPPLLIANAASRLTVEGGTHNSHAPPFDFFERSFLPLINRMGAHVEARLDRHGFYPRGGGRLHVNITPATELAPLHLEEGGAARRIRSTAVVAGLPRHIAERELKLVRTALDLNPDALTIRELPPDQGPGNVLLIEIENEHVTEIITSFGSRGVRAESVGHSAILEAKNYLTANVPIGEHLADQLLLPLALARSGSFVTLPLSRHGTTNIEVIEMFLPVRFEVDEIGLKQCRVKCGS